MRKPNVAEDKQIDTFGTFIYTYCSIIVFLHGHSEMLNVGSPR